VTLLFERLFQLKTAFYNFKEIKGEIIMKKQNLIRRFFMVAVLACGLFGAANNVFADGECGGMLGSGTRCGYLGSGNRAETTTQVETEEPGAFQYVLDTFYKLIF
jgi:hypothetical protein